MFIRAYLRASTKEQDADRAKQTLINCADKHEHKIASFYVENESGRKLKRPELMKLLTESSNGDVILIESIDRLTRLTPDQWEELKGMIKAKGLHVVAVDLPTSHMALSDMASDNMTKGIMNAVNNMLVDILATMACKDYELRRERSAQGVAKAKKQGLYKGRPENVERNAGIAKLLASGMTYSEIQKATGASRATIAKARKQMTLEVA